MISFKQFLYEINYSVLEKDNRIIEVTEELKKICWIILIN